ncbi:DUF3604 domain-containing protein [Alteraurantiacibacter aquimixticola]|uniref:DUF3604 domain-containing protein n=1 Tax=Alteraurantiacibacter aquimixticola TaxID=2489173 RepID=A0A4T3F2A0_9SPHN|nr:DUF3604 domain-containing protein [Alteraurantiacibacter aquimixticola]TIX49535.1 DUF3604 domain-containing protein [Alteraurantiacibacter aquimixticola]
MRYWTDFRSTIATTCAALALVACSQADGDGEGMGDGPPSLLNTGDRQVYFGDLHLHTSYSLDAAAAKTNTTPDDAYMYAKGEAVDYLGRMVQRRTPLDFLAVTDHAEYLGNVSRAMAGEIPVPYDEEEWERLTSHEGGATMFELFGYAVRGLYGEANEGLVDPARSYEAWQDTIAAAERHNDPGTFTSFVAFEYSPTYRSNGAHLHRNVIFRGPTYPAMPFSALDSMNHEALWAYAETNRSRGIESLMIPHNANLSDGLAFPWNDTYGNPISVDYASRRAANEPLVEITQIKGTSETRPELSPDDEFADFEIINSDGDLAGAYVRTGLARGMELAEALGVNPFEQGFVGATDYHSGVSSTEEDNYPGALGLSDDHKNAAAILGDLSPVIGSPLANLSASGLTGVWADENTREAIFAAFQRRETFATSGPRMRVRLFAGWSDPTGFANASDWAAQAYRWGVPMGGNLGAASGSGPTFIMQAAKDPESGNLDRIQIVKVWREGGESFERIYDVAWSGERQPDEDGKLPAVGNTVDAAKATYENTIGAAELFATWSDPDFDPSERALYYARVIEIPTPRWATYLSVASGVPLSESTSPWLQERAWTSPVYYTPMGGAS